MAVAHSKIWKLSENCKNFNVALVSHNISNLVNWDKLGKAIKLLEQFLRMLMISLFYNLTKNSTIFTEFTIIINAKNTKLKSTNIKILNSVKT